MREKHKKLCRALIYIEHFLVLIYVVSACFSISEFVATVGFDVGIASSAVGTSDLCNHCRN